jgi:hypothetical protein
MHPFGPKQIGSDYCPDGKFGPELKPDMVVELDNIDYIVKIITSINFEMFPKDFIKIIQSLQKRSDTHVDHLNIKSLFILKKFNVIYLQDAQYAC